MADGPNDKPAGAKTVPQHELDAQAIREKTARLRALRLAHEAANKPAGGASKPGKRTAAKKKSGKTSEKGVSLSEWLATQEKEGRRS